MQEAAAQAQAMAQTGVWIAEKLLGEQIFAALWQQGSIAQRSLRITLPDFDQHNQHYCAALARVPWEIARPSLDQPSLEEKNLLLHVVHESQASIVPSATLPEGEALRVLCVFADAKGAQPLAARKERLALQALFARHIATQRAVEVHVLSHGVSRARLRAQILRAGQPVAEAPQQEYLARTYLASLDIARQADFAMQNWAVALVRLDAMLEVQHALQRPPEEIAASRVNRAIVQGKLQCFAEASSELESCLPLFAHNLAAKASVLSSLASLFDDQNDIVQALAQERRALALFEDLPDPARRATAHNNLAGYLECSANVDALEEARWHQLAALVYRLVSGLHQHLQMSLHNYGNVFRRARRAMSSNTEPNIPRLAELLARPEFDLLSRWLQQRAIVLEALQADIDTLLAQVRQHVIDEEVAEEGEA